MSRLAACLCIVLAVMLVRAQELPITDVVLFSSGVGYFQRAGTVDGNATVTLSFKTEQINDLLKSMILLDLDGGTVNAVTYQAKDPVSKTLQAFAVNITDNPTLGQLLNRLRGVSVEVVSTTTITGKVLGVEKKEVRVGEDRVTTVEVLNLVTADGIRSVRLDEITAIKILDERLNRELQEALLVTASGLDNQRKPVMISFTGTGKRRVIVGYLVETPLWKTSYRLVLGEQQHLLQGWAIVENTSESDWTNVRLSLVSGRPISFIQDLYTPLYLPRPVVQPQLYASLRPQQYEEGIPGDRNAMMPTTEAPVTATPAPPPPSVPPTGRSGLAGPSAGMLDMNAAEYGEAVRSSVIASATASDLGQAFEYTIKTPVTLPRQQSALLPIVSSSIEAWPVSIYNAAVHPQYPLYGLRLKNTTGVHLMGGPITIYNGNVYAGDATFEDLQPGEQRLISYAVDLGVAGERKENPQAQEIVTVKLARGNLTVTRKFRRTVQYTFIAKDGKARKIIVEHPFLAGWTLVEPKEADERTDRLYRFTLETNETIDGKPGAELTVVEEKTAAEVYRIVELETPVIVSYLQSGRVSPAVREALQRVVQMQNQVQETRRQKSGAEQEITTITNEQARIRQNMAALDRNSDLYKRYVDKLNEQETRIEQLRARIAELQQQEDAQQQALEEYVAGLNLE